MTKMGRRCFAASALTLRGYAQIIRVLSRAVRDTLALAERPTRPEPVAQIEADRFTLGFEEGDYERASAETLLRFLAFQEKELRRIGREPGLQNKAIKRPNKTNNRMV